MKITVVGTGYVGLSNAVLLSQNHDVVCLDINEDRVTLINNKKSPIEDKEIIEYLNNYSLSLTATTDLVTAYKDSEFVVVATPTDYDVETNYFNTSSVEGVICDVLKYNEDATIIIKSLERFP